MEIACTKKLLDYLGIKAEKAPDKVESLFGWTANLLVINRRKAIVVVHTASRCCFVLYGVTAKDKRNLTELILDGVRKLLESEYVRPEIIERFLDDLGREISLKANSSRKAVASCNKACERVKFFSELMEPGELLQRNLILCLNDDILAVPKYTYAHQMLIGLLQERYGENVRSCQALELEVSLELHTPCKRRIIVPENLNFYQFHNVLQNCFAWQDCHLHQYVVAVDSKGYPTKIIVPPYDEMEDYPGVQIQSSTDITLAEVFASRKMIVYEYDFGDDWLHTIELCRAIEDCREPYPRCIAAEGDAPPEDCGGPGGFAHMMSVLENPKHPEHADISEWIRGAWRMPPDAERISRWIQDAHRKSMPIW